MISADFSRYQLEGVRCQAARRVKGAGNAKISIESNKIETIGATHVQQVMHDKLDTVN